MSPAHVAVAVLLVPLVMLATALVEVLVIRHRRVKTFKQYQVEAVRACFRKQRYKRHRISITTKDCDNKRFHGDRDKPFIACQEAEILNHLAAGSQTSDISESAISDLRDLRASPLHHDDFSLNPRPDKSLNNSRGSWPPIEPLTMTFIEEGGRRSSLDDKLSDQKSRFEQLSSLEYNSQVSLNYSPGASSPNYETEDTKNCSDTRVETSTSIDQRNDDDEHGDIQQTNNVFSDDPPGQDVHHVTTDLVTDKTNEGVQSCLDTDTGVSSTLASTNDEQTEEDTLDSTVEVDDTGRLEPDAETDLVSSDSELDSSSDSMETFQASSPARETTVSGPAQTHTPEDLDSPREDTKPLSGVTAAIGDDVYESRPDILQTEDLVLPSLSLTTSFTNTPTSDSDDAVDWSEDDKDSSWMGKFEHFHLNKHEVIQGDDLMRDVQRLPTTSEDDIFLQDVSEDTSGTVRDSPPTFLSTMTQSHQEQSQTDGYSPPVSDQRIKDERRLGINSTSVDSSPDTNLSDVSSESFESLDGAVSPVDRLEISWRDPDPQLADEDRKPWSSTVDMKKFDETEIKRQDLIWGFIINERQYVRRLRIMQKLFAHSMLHDLKYPEELVDKMFPRLNELVELHVEFLHQLLARQAINEDKSVDKIGDILIEQFQGVTADKIKSIYGVFCSKHEETIQIYKMLVKNDRKFQDFVRKCSRLPVCGKHQISDFILSVSVRLTKYPILIDHIQEKTKGQRDKENLIIALLSCQNVVHCVDMKIDAYKKLLDIQGKMDNKAVIFLGRKFKRHDLTINNRELVHVGKIGWKSAQKKVYEVLAVVLSDIIVFLQTNDQKYTFLMQDNKSCVIPLHNLLVRERSNVKNNRGLYIINQIKAMPEMHELVCQDEAERDQWMRILNDAIKVSQTNIKSNVWSTAKVGSAYSDEIDQKRQAEQANKVKQIVDQLHHKDKMIMKCCDEKNKLLLELLKMFAAPNETASFQDAQEMNSWSELMEILQAAILEATHLTDILQDKRAQMSWSISSAGEHRSKSYVSASVPKRAETFSGFPNSYQNTVKGYGLSQKVSVRQEMETGSTDSLSTEQQERIMLDTPYTPSESKYTRGIHPWRTLVRSSESSDKDSLEELSTDPLSPTSASQDQVTSTLHLMQYLNAVMNLTSKQNTQVQSLSLELAQAKEQIAKLLGNSHGRRTGYSHDQLEELRSLQGNLSQEKQEWEMKKLQELSSLTEQREKLENERRDLEKEKFNLQIQMKEMFRDESFKTSSSFEDRVREINLVKTDNSASSHPPQSPIIHFKSASADLYSPVHKGYDENVERFSPYQWKTTNGQSHQPHSSVGDLQQDYSNYSSPTEQIDFTFHLMDTYNDHINNLTFPNLQHKNPELYGINAVQHQQQTSPTAAQSPASHSYAQDIGQAAWSEASYDQSMQKSSHPTSKVLKHRHSMSTNLPQTAERKGKSFLTTLTNLSKSSSFSRKSNANPQSSNGLGGKKSKDASKRA